MPCLSTAGDYWLLTRINFILFPIFRFYPKGGFHGMSDFPIRSNAMDPLNEDFIITDLDNQAHYPHL